MKYGFVFPGGEARTAAEFAHAAEEAGWDGFFVWEPVWGTDAWVSLAAAAMVTERIRLGTMITPISRMRPWKLASETATLDRLSNGRAILSVGLGALESGFAAFGEVTDRVQRAELLDEGLELLTRLWVGMPMRFEGKHYRVEVNENTFLTPPPPPPAQQPRIPIWVVGAWPRKKSMERALRYDGLLPNVMGADGKVRMSPATPQEVGEMRAYVTAQRAEKRPFDIVVEGETPGDDPVAAAAIVRPYVEAGATWWLEARWTAPDLAMVLERIRQGPPK
jgi:alkanesulfonate monooxygenase SsuD/methylene tetrahydromethanopterin reductase-like flavin-dependent oxidoreductase (luciferase family)